MSVKYVSYIKNQVPNLLLDFQRQECLKSVQSALSDLKHSPERLQSQCNYRPFIT